MRKWVIGIALMCLGVVGVQEAIEASRPRRPDVELIVNAAMAPGRTTIKDVLKPDDKDLVTLNEEWSDPKFSEPFEESLKGWIKSFEQDIDRLTENMKGRDRGDAKQLAYDQEYVNKYRTYLSNLKRVKAAIESHQVKRKPVAKVPLRSLKLDPRINLETAAAHSAFPFPNHETGQLSFPTFSADQNFAFMRFYGQSYHPYVLTFFLERTRTGWKVIAKGEVYYM